MRDLPPLNTCLCGGVSADKNVRRMPVELLKIAASVCYHILEVFWIETVPTESSDIREVF